MSQTKLRGVVTVDPVDGIPIGGSIQVQSLLLKGPPGTKAAWVEQWESLQGTVLGVTFSTSDAHQVEGTAVLVSPGVAICAAHVIEPKFGDIVHSRISLNCFGPTPRGLQLWRLKKITFVPATDLAILGLTLISGLSAGETLYQASITTRLPKLDEPLTIFGLRATADEFARPPAAPSLLSMTFLVCSGTVRARFVEGRDRVMMPWPTLEVDCPSWGGMSGGPVCDGSGRVVGLLSSSLSSASHDGPSYVSLIFPAIPVQFEGGWPEAMHVHAASLLNEGIHMCDIDNRNAFVPVDPTPSGEQVLQYDPWE